MLRRTVRLAYLFTVVLIASCNGGSGPGGPQTVIASAGGTVSSGPATLSIPAGALSADAQVNLVDRGPATARPEDPLRPASAIFAVELKPVAGGAPVTLTKAATLTLATTATIGTDVSAIVVAESDPDQAAATFLHVGKLGGKQDGPSTTVSYDLKEPGRFWLLTVPAPPAKPVEKFVLQVPWYWQGGIPWCMPTSISEMMRYYDFSEEADTLNGSFGASTALANWQIAGKNGQATSSGAGLGELDSIGAKGHWEAKVWDMDFFLSGETTKDNILAFENYVIATNTGNWGHDPRKPLGLAVDYWWHAVVVVGMDADGVYLHDSNGPIAEKMDWLKFATSTRGLVTEAAKPGEPPPKPRYAHTVASIVVFDYPVKPASKRQASVVIGPGDLAVGSGPEMQGKLAWDGAAPHTKGYFFKHSLTGADVPALRSLPLSYQYRIANVTDVALTFKTVAELSGPAFGEKPVQRVHTVTVDPYSLSKVLTGQFDQPSAGAGATFTVRLYEVENRESLQDAKFIQYAVVEPSAPSVTITSPTATDKVYGGSLTPLVSTSYDPSSNKAIPDDQLKWSIDGAPFATGSKTSVTFDTTGTHAITLTGTALGGKTATATVSITVEKPPLPPSVTIVEPKNGAVFDTGSYTASSVKVSLAGSGTNVMTLAWRSSVQGALGTGPTLSPDLTTLQIGNCAPWTDHILTLEGKDSGGAVVASQSVTVSVHTMCIK